MNLNVKTTTYGSDSKTWLGSEEGTNRADAVTLDPTLMLAVFTDGHVPSGVTLGKVTATGRYGPYSDAAVDGRQVNKGHLFDHAYVTAGSNEGAAILWHGEVVVANLPTNNGLDANGQADIPLIHYV